MASVKMTSNGLLGTMAYEKSNLVELPNEVLIHIMEFLPLSDRISAGLVCHAWHEASRDIKFLDKEAVILHGNVQQMLQVFQNSSSRFFHFAFFDVELSVNFNEFCSKYCQCMRSLSIESCDISEKQFINILKQCSNLQSLSIVNCRELLMSGRVLELESDMVVLRKTLLRLKKLHLGFNRYLSDALFNRFVAIVPNLEHLVFTKCQMAFHAGLYNKFYPSKLSESGTMIPSESILTFHNILQYITLQAHKLKIMEFGGTLMDNVALNKLVEVPHLQLESLNLMGCDQLTHKAVVGITKYQTNLKELDISMCSRIVDPSLILICDSLTNLTSLSLRRCRALTNSSVSHLRKLKLLRSVDLSYCDSVTSPGIEEGLCSQVNVKLRKLNLSGLSLGEKTICRLATNLPKLLSLDLSWCGSAVTDRAIQAICCNLVWLRTLKLEACDKITDSGLTGMGIGGFGQQSTENGQLNYKQKIDVLPLVDEAYFPADLKETHKISLRSRAEQDIVNDARRKEMVSQMCEEQYLKATETGQSLARLQGLRVLDLSGCNRITDVSLKYAFCFRELQVLSISQCQQITHVGLSFLAANNTSIEDLEMSHCYNVTDDGIESVTSSLHRLRILNVQSCNQLTDRSLTAVGQYCHKLQFLDVSLCIGMSLEECERVERLLPTLHTFLHRSVVHKNMPFLDVTRPPPRAPAPRPPPPPPRTPSRGLRALWRR